MYMLNKYHAHIPHEIIFSTVLKNAIWILIFLFYSNSKIKFIGRAEKML